MKGQRKPKEREVPGHRRSATETVNLTTVFGKIMEQIIMHSVVEHLR